MNARKLITLVSALTIALTLMLTGFSTSGHIAAQGGTPEPTRNAALAPDPLGGATTFAKVDPAVDVTVMLDYTPNTNHLGLYIAQAKGYYKEAGLNVTIQPAGDVAVDQVVALGKAQFGIGYQEGLTYSRASGTPIVSVAAIIQHNTSGFASLAEKKPLKSPADLAGKRYGAFGSPIEKPFLNALLTCKGGQPDTVEMIDIGFSEPFPLMERDRIDITWIFYGWDGIRAKQQGLTLDVLMLKDYQDCIPDYYTPLLTTSEQLIKEKPDLVRAFVQATARGYADAIKNPAEAADILLKAVPELDSALVKESTAWLADQFQADAAQWGIQTEAIWNGLADFMVKNKALDAMIDTKAAFTNEFLPRP